MHASCRGQTPLHFAASAKRNALEACKLLLQHGADVGAPDMMGMMPYERAGTPAVRTLLGGPDQRLFDYAGQQVQRNML